MKIYYKVYWCEVGDSRDNNSHWNEWWVSSYQHCLYRLKKSLLNEFLVDDTLFTQYHNRIKEIIDGDTTKTWEFDAQDTYEDAIRVLNELIPDKE